MAKVVTTDLGAYNLVGDGTTDNLAHLNAAMAAYTLADGKWVWPAGTYILSAKPNAIPNNSVWEGEGMTLTVIKGTRASPSVTPVLELSSASNVTLRNLHVTTSDDANSAQQCFDVTAGNNLSFDRVKMSNGYSAGIRASTPVNNLTYTGGEVTNIHQDPSASGFSGCMQNTLIEGNYFHNMSTEGGGTRHCVYTNSNPGSNVYNVMVRNNRFESYGNGPAVNFKGDGSGSATGAAWACSAIGNTFGNVSNSQAIAAQGAQGLQITGNQIYAVSPGVDCFELNGDCWDFLIDANVFYSGPAYFGGEFITLAGGNGGGKISNNIFGKANGFYELCYGIFILNGSVGNLEICNNKFIGMYCGVYMGASATYVPGAGGVGDIWIHDNNFSIPAGGTDVTSPAAAVAGLTNGQSAAVIIDGKVQTVRIENNKVVGTNFNVAFATGTFLGTSGNADSVSVRPYAPTALASLLHSGTGSPAPTNVAVAAATTFTAFPYGTAGHAYTTPTT